MVKQYTTEEVKKHNSNESTWVVIHNEIYDVTAFLNEHPGGEEVLLEQSGGDGSEAFEDIGHSSDARDLMCKYKIGEIVESERKPLLAKKTNWEDETVKRHSTSKTWIIPIVVGLLVTIIYQYFF